MRQNSKLPRGWKTCQNCFNPFKPRPQKIDEQRFCGGNCRKEYWKHGGVSVHKLKGYVHQWVREELARLGIQGKVA